MTLVAHWRVAHAVLLVSSCVEVLHADVLLVPFLLALDILKDMDGLHVLLLLAACIALVQHVHGLVLLLRPSR